MTTRRELIGASVLSVPVGLALAKAAAATGSHARYPVPTPDIARLLGRGNRSSWPGDTAARYVGMPIGGIASGTVYLGGDGSLWCWDIFNEHHEGVVPARTADPAMPGARGRRLRERDGANYLHPPRAGSGPWQIFQGSALRIHEGNTPRFVPLSAQGFGRIRFAGQPPAADVTFEDDALPVSATLHAWTPWIPLEVDASSFPATVLDYRWTNRSNRRLRVSLESWLENPVLRGAGERNDVPILNRAFDGGGFAGVSLEADLSAPLADFPDPGERPDFGSMALLCRAPRARADADGFPFRPEGEAPAPLADSHPWSPAIANVGCDTILAPGESAAARIIIAWQFPNLHLQARTWDKRKPFALARTRRWSAPGHNGAGAVARDLARHSDSLAATSRAFRDAWYDSTLPHWLLEQTMTAANTLQTQTLVRFADGRFWGWEGVGCCPGTCTHVWNYAQSAARLFPAVERRHREEVDFGIALGADGAIGMRAEFDPTPAADGQPGTILRAYREHLMSPDGAFLARTWPSISRALDWLVAQDGADGTANGMITGRQHNTLDADWYGRIPFCATLYVAALRAGEAMAAIMGDSAKTARYGALAASGSDQIAQLFDRDLGYFVHIPSLEHPDAPGHERGCHIDQAIGQWWTRQLGLPDILRPDQVRSALNAIWTHNHFSDIGVLRASIPDPKRKGLAFALDGEAGTVTCAWPEGVPRTDHERHWQACYFNSCMTGFEFQLAGHMIWESDGDAGLLGKGLMVARAVFDRYAPEKRNPYNMIEASDHYARAMAAHGVFLALCGFEHDGSRGHVGFRPRAFDGDRFKAGFVTAEGWGSFEQRGSHVTLAPAYGRVRLATLGLRAASGSWSKVVRSSHGQPGIERGGRDVLIRFDGPVTIQANQPLQLELG